jgi:ABC-type multidrug transport system fused ATPase/permease subunit
VKFSFRLLTVIDYDRIIVLDKGQVVEFDTPASLIAKENGVFRGMCKQSDSFELLQEMALKAQTSA